MPSASLPLEMHAVQASGHPSSIFCFSLAWTSIKPRTLDKDSLADLRDKFSDVSKVPWTSLRLWSHFAPGNRFGTYTRHGTVEHT
jgi:hypothetical protein